MSAVPIGDEFGKAGIAPPISTLKSKSTCLLPIPRRYCRWTAAGPMWLSCSDLGSDGPNQVGIAELAPRVRSVTTYPSEASSATQFVISL